MMHLNKKLTLPLLLSLVCSNSFAGDKEIKELQQSVNELKIMMQAVLAENQRLKDKNQQLVPYVKTGYGEELKYANAKNCKIGAMVWSKEYCQAQGNFQNEGQIKSRVLKFNKLKSAKDSHIRINYTDNLRVEAATVSSCQWEIKIDGKSCKIPLKYGFYGKDNLHRSQSLLGYCEGLEQGNDYEIQIWLSTVKAHPVGDCHTGWRSTWTIEAQEIDIRPKQVDTKNKKVSQ